VNLLLTLGTLFILIAALIGLRLRWPRLSPRTRKACIAAALTLFTLSAISTVTHWRLASGILDSLLEWSRDLSYIFLVLLFTVLRPRWLTIPIAIILILPIFSASIVLPLGGLFAFGSDTVVDLGNHLRAETTPFASPQHASGVDIAVFYRMPWMPLLEKRVAGAHILNTQCNTAKSFVVIDRDPPGHIVFHCPAWPGQPLSQDHLFLYPLH